MCRRLVYYRRNKHHVYSSTCSSPPSLFWSSWLHFTAFRLFFKRYFSISPPTPTYTYISQLVPYLRFFFFDWLKRSTNFSCPAFLVLFYHTNTMHIWWKAHTRNLRLPCTPVLERLSHDVRPSFMPVQNNRRNCSLVQLNFCAFRQNTGRAKILIRSVDNYVRSYWNSPS